MAPWDSSGVQSTGRRQFFVVDIVPSGYRKRSILEWMGSAGGVLIRVNYKEGTSLDGSSSATLASAYYEKAPFSYDAMHWACDNFAVFCKTGNPDTRTQSNKVATNALNKMGQAALDGIFKVIEVCFLDRSKRR